MLIFELGDVRVDPVSSELWVESLPNGVVYAVTHFRWIQRTSPGVAPFGWLVGFLMNCTARALAVHETS